MVFKDDYNFYKNIFVSHTPVNGPSLFVVVLFWMHVNSIRVGVSLRVRVDKLWIRVVYYI